MWLRSASKAKCSQLLCIALFIADIVFICSLPPAFPPLLLSFGMIMHSCLWCPCTMPFAQTFFSLDIIENHSKSLTPSLLTKYPPLREINASRRRFWLPVNDVFTSQFGFRSTSIMVFETWLRVLWDTIFEMFRTQWLAFHSLLSTICHSAFMTPKVLNDFLAFKIRQFG